ncbi:MULTISPECIES: alpha/beta hydrolase [Methylomicrobium]|uniref:Lysophospholipase n=1 Tax=Methylomicrobium album BG8 TaxID=686340 RepID=H8GP54_METAL|nr:MULTISPECIES: alpha/beta hydrolase [Methylomicrobium]EIC29640.1 lysophospholipase [Methylomicrobium album BG8]
MKKIVSILSLITLLLSGCMPSIYPSGAKTTVARLDTLAFITEDGARLPLRSWLPQGEPKAVIIAVHGFNDYSRFFDQPARYFSEHGIASFAYDQRGFGAAPKRGLWAGSASYADDLLTLARLVKERYPRSPIFLLGESMGGAVVMTAAKHDTTELVDGIILAAPALWARKTMPWYQNSLLWILAHTTPWLRLTGKGVVKVTPSDNIEMLRELGRDPWVIKGARVETLYGLANLMDLAFNSADSLTEDTLLLYGEKDDIIPKKPTYAFLQRFLKHKKNPSGEKEKTVAFYQQGYHMLLRDLQADKTWQDIAAWIDSRKVHLPSGADRRAEIVLKPVLTSFN